MSARPTEGASASAPNSDSTASSRAPPEGSLGVAALLSLSGGFLDAFTYVGHGQVFANAMTGNIVLLGVYTATGDWLRAFNHIPPIIAFLAGVFAARLLRRYGARREPRSVALLCLTVEILTLGGLAFLPDSYPDIWIVLTISFVAALQNSSFTRVQDWTYNSVMTTGNLRRFAEGLFDGFVPARDSGALKQARIFGAICLSFLVGACLGGVSSRWLGNAALLVAVVVLAAILLHCLGFSGARFRQPVNKE
jgi:uncharacterized membrane protein YoaK (UPF0700 family)